LGGDERRAAGIERRAAVSSAPSPSRWRASTSGRSSGSGRWIEGLAVALLRQRGEQSVPVAPGSGEQLGGVKRQRPASSGGCQLGGVAVLVAASSSGRRSGSGRRIEGLAVALLR
jgi:hypothetical protein